MDHDWKNIPIDKILNYEGTNPGEISRLDRIMQHRTVEGMNGLSGRLDDVVNKLTGVIGTIYRVGQLAQEKADSAIAAANTASTAQGRQQRAMKWLTLALVACTVAYTAINGVVVYEMREGNKIQREIADAAKEPAGATREGSKVEKPLPSPQSLDPGY